MKRRTEKTRPTDRQDQAANGARGALRLVNGSSRIIEWPRPPANAAPGHGVATTADAPPHVGVLVKAEVQTKRFHDRNVETERYTATLRATDGSPYALMAALVEACSGVEEFHVVGAPSDQIILQVTLRR
jgi:hypothetical protein